MRAGRPWVLSLPVPRGLPQAQSCPLSLLWAPATSQPKIKYLGRRSCAGRGQPLLSCPVSLTSLFVHAALSQQVCMCLSFVPDRHPGTRRALVQVLMRPFRSCSPDAREGAAGGCLSHPAVWRGGGEHRAHYSVVPLQRASMVRATPLVPRVEMAQRWSSLPGRLICKALSLHLKILQPTPPSLARLHLPVC